MYRRKNFRRRKAPKGKSKRRSTSSVRKVVKSELMKMVEDKVYVQDLSGATSGNNLMILTGSSSTLPLYFDLNPLIAQNGTVVGRVGNKCRLKRHILKCQMSLNGAAITAGVDVPMNIYYFVLYARDTAGSLTASDLNNLFYYYSGGSSTTQFLSGSGFATTHRVNNDYFKILKTNYPNKPMKLGWSQYSAGGLYSNNDYKSNMHFNIDLSRLSPKLLHFNNSTSACTNMQMFICFYVQKVNYDITTTDWDAPSLYLTQEIHFEDA